jgi:Na+-transporting NADH:ubiquinone oxidoreductase subunit F
MLEIGLGVALFTAIVLVLVLAVLAARTKLVATGEVEITVNEATKFQAPVGHRSATSC